MSATRRTTFVTTPHMTDGFSTVRACRVMIASEHVRREDDEARALEDLGRQSARAPDAAAANRRGCAERTGEILIQR